jgi:ABC-type transport system involved in multi-copper enzyme maturation permease subunit
MMMTLFRKELREARWKLIVGVGIAALTGAFLPYGFDILKESTRMIGDIPWMSGIQRQIEAQASDYRLYLWANWYGKNLPQYLLVLVAIVGGASLAGEKSSGTFQFLLSRPVSRKQVFAAKYAAGATVVAATVLGGTLASLTAWSLIGRSVSWTWFLSGVPAQILGGLFLLSLAMILSALLDDALKAGVFAFAVMMVMTIVETVPPARGRLIFGMMAAGRSFSSGLPTPLPLFILAAAAALAGALALNLFCKRDV